MLTGIPLLAIAFFTILGTIVAILKIDRSISGRSTWHRLWLILSAPYLFPDPNLTLMQWFDSRPELHRARYDVVLTTSSLLLYWIAHSADVRFQVTVSTFGYLLLSRLANIAGGIFAWSGMGYGLTFMFRAMHRRTPLRFLAFFLLFLLSFSLVFLHPFGFAGQWPPIAVWVS